MRWPRRLARRSQANADGEGVWSCPPDAGVKRMEMIRSRRRLTSPVLRGERAISRKTIAQGRPGRPGRTCMLVCVPFFCTRDRGCGQHPAFPAPSSLREGRDFRKARAERAARMRRCAQFPSSFRDARSAGPESITTEGRSREGPSVSCVATTPAWGYGSPPSRGRQRNSCLRGQIGKSPRGARTPHPPRYARHPLPQCGRGAKNAF